MIHRTEGQRIKFWKEGKEKWVWNWSQQVCDMPQCAWWTWAQPFAKIWMCQVTNTQFISAGGVDHKGWWSGQEGPGLGNTDAPVKDWESVSPSSFSACLPHPAIRGRGVTWWWGATWQSHTWSLVFCLSEAPSLPSLQSHSVYFSVLSSTTPGAACVRALKCLRHQSA